MAEESKVILEQIQKSLPPPSVWVALEKSIDRVPVDERAIFVKRFMTFVGALLIFATGWLTSRGQGPQVVYFERAPVPVIVDAGADQ